jgi:sterol 3beta-glucosyltransferase
MKIGMQTWGSHGDIRPMLALAEGLQAAGHEVTLVITCFNSADYQHIQSTHGVKLIMVASPMVSDEKAEEFAIEVFGEANPMKQLGLIFRKAFLPAEAAMLEAAEMLCRENALVIGHLCVYPLQIMAEKMGRPYFSVMLTHSVVPSKFCPPPSFPSLGKIVNSLVWWLAKVLINHQIIHYPNRLRQQLGLPAAKDIMTEVWVSKQLTLLGVSTQLCPRQPDWPAYIQVCGFFDMPNIALSTLEGCLPESLNAFLQAGDAPVYMTFGSMVAQTIAQNTETLQLLSQTAKLAGCRAIIQAPMWQECGFTQTDQLLFVSATPHHLVFPHCLAVLHHGGAGTTQSATLAGKPSIVVAHIAEQMAWGNELKRVGIAGKPVARHKATPESLAQQIRQVASSPEMQTRAQAIGTAMRQENGVAVAVRLIEEKFKRQA